MARMGHGASAVPGAVNLRVSVFVQWVWTYLTGQRGSRLIVNHHGSESSKLRIEDAPEVLTLRISEDAPNDP